MSNLNAELSALRVENRELRAEQGRLRAQLSVVLRMLLDNEMRLEDSLPPLPGYSDEEMIALFCAFSQRPPSSIDLQSLFLSREGREAIVALEPFAKGEVDDLDEMVMELPVASDWKLPYLEKVLLARFSNLLVMAERRETIGFCIQQISSILHAVDRRGFETELSKVIMEGSAALALLKGSV